MSDQAQVIAKKRIVVEVVDAVTVRRDIEVAIDGADTIAVDVYEPPQPARAAVLIAAGYPDRGFQSFLGCRFKEMGWVVSWAELIAASGLTAIAYSAPDPLHVNDLLKRIGDGAIDGVRGDRIGVLASSGSGPLAMSLLRREAAVPIRCAALLYAYTVDLDGATSVAAAAEQFRFVNPGAEDLRDDVPLFLARAGRDETPGLNDALDSFAAHALRRNMPVTIVNHATAPHAFDLFDDSAPTHDIIRQVLAFFAAHA